MLFQARKKSFIKLYFSPDKLRRMKQSFAQKANQALSTNDALCAHLCSWISRFEENPLNRKIAIAVNYRNKTAIDNQALGNFVETVQIPTSPTSERYQIAQAIRNAVDTFAEQHLNYFATCDYIEQKGGLRKISRFVNNC